MVWFPEDGPNPSWSDVYDVLFGFAVPADWEVQAGGYLFWRGFATEAIRTVLDHARAHGTVECFDALPLPMLDRQAIEQLLPESPDESWNAYSGLWEPTQC